MKSVSCNVIEDLIPLYLEDMLSEDSKNIVETHLNECEQCREYLEELQVLNSLPIEDNTKPLKKIQKSLQKKKWTAIILTALITLFIGALSVIYITAPKYLPYSEELVTINETGNGFTLVNFNDEVAGYDLKSYTTESETESVHHLTTWTTTWHEWKNTEEITPIVLNTSGEQVEAIYYYQTNTATDQLIYGEDQHVNGGIITLPRLSMNYLTGAAVFILVVCVGILFIIRSNQIYFERMIKIIFLPISYLLAQLFVTRLDATTYSLVRDFTAIILVAILLYGVFWIGYETLKKRSLN